MKVDKLTAIITLLITLIVVIVLYRIYSCNQSEGFRDPLWMNRSKMTSDWYPRSNGSIYGYPYNKGGSWSIFSGYPYYNAGS